MENVAFNKMLIFQYKVKQQVCILIVYNGIELLERMKAFYKNNGMCFYICNALLFKVCLLLFPTNNSSDFL